MCLHLHQDLAHFEADGVGLQGGRDISSKGRQQRHLVFEGMRWSQIWPWSKNQKLTYLKLPIVL